MRPTRGPSFALPALVTAPLLAMALAACTTPDPKLPVYTGGTTPATSSTSGGTTSPTPSGSGTSATTSGPSTPARPVAVTITRRPLAAGIPTTTKPVTDAWFGYWEYVGRAISNPRAEGAVENVGSVATGTAASDAVSQISDLKSKNQHTIGETRITVSKATLSGAAGTVCSTFDDRSYDVDTKGVPVQPVIPRAFTFSATLKLDGPTWRVEKVTRVASC